MKLTVEQIAIVCHEANRAYCKVIGDNPQPSWEDAPQWQKDSVISGTLYRLHNRYGSGEETHNKWMNDKLEDGWTYGPVKDAVAKTHPCLVPYEKLPIEQQAKDYLFSYVVSALCGMIVDEYSTPFISAKAAYHRYGSVTDFKNFRGEPMPKWEELPEKIQQAWIAAVN